MKIRSLYTKIFADNINTHIISVFTTFFLISTFLFIFTNQIINIFIVYAIYLISFSFYTKIKRSYLKELSKLKYINIVSHSIHYKEYAFKFSETYNTVINFDGANLSKLSLKAVQIFYKNTKYNKLLHLFSDFNLPKTIRIYEVTAMIENKKYKVWLFLPHVFRKTFSFYKDWIHYNRISLYGDVTNGVFLEVPLNLEKERAFICIKGNYSDYKLVKKRDKFFNILNQDDGKKLLFRELRKHNWDFKSRTKLLKLLNVDKYIKDKDFSESRMDLFKLSSYYSIDEIMKLAKQYRKAKRKISNYFKDN